MAHLKACNTDEATFNRCLAAIKKACSTELWLDSFVESSEKRQKIDDSMNVLLHWWKSFDDTDIKYLYINSSKDKAEYKYVDSKGKTLRIGEQIRGKAHVYECIGFPENTVTDIEGLTHEQLYNYIEDKLKFFIDETDFDLKITCVDNM